MVKFICSAIVVVSLFATADAAHARRWFQRRAVSVTRTTVRTTVRYAGSPAQVAATKVSVLARRGYGGHIGGGYGGANAEGWGSGPTAQAALNACCFTGQRRLAGSAVARSGNRWFAVKLYW